MDHRLRSVKGRNSVLEIGIALLLVQVLSLSVANAAVSRIYYTPDEPTKPYALVCPVNETLQDTLPCCEPTCDNDCSTANCGEECVRQPTCVCKTGFVRHKGSCIRKCDCPPRAPCPPTCGTNEELLPSPPCCEPTCTEDCSTRIFHTRYVDQPTCVCKKGYRRHNDTCIRIDECPTCGPYASLKPYTPCCEPTCDKDCNSVLRNTACSSDPACVCQQGYVKRNGTCIKRELCPPHPPKPFYHRTEPKQVPSPEYRHPSNPDKPARCGCNRPTQEQPKYPHTTPAPPVVHRCKPESAPCPSPPEPDCPKESTPCPYVPACSPRIPVAPYQLRQQPNPFKDQPYYAIPALRHCSCGGGPANPAVSRSPVCPSPGMGQPVRPKPCDCNEQSYVNEETPIAPPPYGAVEPAHKPPHYESSAVVAPAPVSDYRSPYPSPFPEQKGPGNDVSYLTIPCSGQHGSHERPEDQLYITPPPPAAAQQPVDVKYLTLPSSSCRSRSRSSNGRRTN